jgi:hypothetical protein
MEKRMSTFVSAIEGDENFSACGAIYIASWLRRARTMDIALCYSSLQKLIAMMVTSDGPLMHGERVGAHALKAERVFAAQRNRFHALSVLPMAYGGTALADVAPGAVARRPMLGPLQ